MKDDLDIFDPQKYELGKLCKYKHEYKGTGLSVRYRFSRSSTGMGSCVLCRRSSQLRHRQLHPEAVKRASRAYRWANRDKAALYRAKRREEKLKERGETGSPPLVTKLNISNSDPTNLK